MSLSIERNVERRLHCSIDGNPTPDYQWFAGDIRKATDDNAILSHGIDYLIKNKENNAPESKQSVTCIAKNNRGRLRQVFILQFTNFIE